MRVARRRQFAHPQTRSKVVEVEVPRLFGRSTREKVTQYDEVPFEETLKGVTDFVTELGPDRVISVSEYRQARYLNGDDRSLVWVVWYWSEEAASEK